MTVFPKKFVCAWCKKKFVSAIRPPYVLDGKHGRLGKSHKVAKIGEPVVDFQGYAVRAPGHSRFSGSEFACSPECYEKLTGHLPENKQETKDDPSR